MKKNILIVGCGNLGDHMLPKLFNKFNVFATNRKIKYESKSGFTNIELDLSLYPKKKLPSIFNIVLYTVPPISVNHPRKPLLEFFLTHNLCNVNKNPIHFIYIGTTGIYGDHHGKKVSEESQLLASEERSRLRIMDEEILRRYSQVLSLQTTILRVSGITSNRRFKKDSLPTIIPAKANDVIINRIHLDDLVNSVVYTLFNKKNNRAYNISDGKKIKYGDYYEYVARLLKIKAPERLSKYEYCARVNKNFLTFLTQSKFVDISRLLNETNWRPNFDLENYLKNESA